MNSLLNIKILHLPKLKVCLWNIWPEQAWKCSDEYVSFFFIKEDVSELTYVASYVLSSKPFALSFLQFLKDLEKGTFFFYKVISLFLTLFSLS